MNRTTTGTKEELVAVVENDVGVRTSLIRILNVNGVSTAPFTSAEHFLADAKTVRASCALVNVHLPGMSGFDLRSKLVLNGSVLPVILVTGDQDAAERARLVGAPCLLKPFSPNVLLEAIALATTRA